MDVEHSRQPVFGVTSDNIIVEVAAHRPRLILSEEPLVPEGTGSEYKSLSRPVIRR